MGGDGTIHHQKSGWNVGFNNQKRRILQLGFAVISIFHGLTVSKKGQSAGQSLNLRPQII